jgi:hypothetical protein
VKIAVHAKITEFEIKDPDGPIKIGVREAREAELEKRYELFKQREQVVNDGAKEIVYRQSLNLYSVRDKELYLTLAYVKGIIDEATNGELFKHGTDGRGSLRISAAMKEDDFLEALSLVPVEIVNAMSNYVHKVNPSWGDYYEEEPEPEKQEIESEVSAVPEPSGELPTQ